jgi:hypothetical protein
LEHEIPEQHELAGDLRIAPVVLAALPGADGNAEGVLERFCDGVRERSRRSRGAVRTIDGERTLRTMERRTMMTSEAVR